MGKEGRSAGKSRLSGRRATDDRSAKRHKPAAQQPGIRAFLQPLPRPPAAFGDGRDSSEEPEDAAQLPSQTPAVPLLSAAAPPPTGAPTAAGAKLQTALLRSLQHRFATQQALDTPAGWGAPAAGSTNQLGDAAAAAPPAPAGDGPAAAAAFDDEEEDEEEEDGFQIFSQLAYEPTFLSQRPPDLGDEGGAAGTSQLATQTQLLPGGSEQQHVAAAPRSDDDALDWPAGSQPAGSQPQLTQPQSQQPEAVPRRVSGPPTVKTTPALHSAERVRCDRAGPSGQKMFPLFRRRDSLKKLYIVRHGESTYNAAMAARGSGWADPQIFDAQLTDRGQQQAVELRKELAALDLPPDTLWLTSPLQRAMQTLLLACPHAHLLQPAGAGSSGGGEQPPTVMVLQSITEKLITCGDIGHPASELRRRFPQLEAQLGALPELWWHSPPGRPNCAVQKCFGCSEGKELVMSRVGAFRRWLADRPEKVIVAVGHSSYWRTFEQVCSGGGKPLHMRNCEVRLINF